MRARYLALAAVWYAATYLAVVRGQGNLPAWWYIGLLAAGAAPLMLAAANLWSRLALIFGVALLPLTAPAGVLSIGLLLVPCLVAAAVVAARPAARPRTSPPA